MRKDKNDKKTKNKDIEKVDRFINTMISNYLRRNNIKSVTDLPEEQIENLFKEIDNQFRQFADYDEEMQKKIESIKQNIISLKKKLIDDEFKKKMRYDRSAVEEGTDPKARATSMPLDNLKGTTITVKTTVENDMLKVNENIEMKSEPQTMDIRDVLKVVTVESFMCNTPDRYIAVKPRGGLEYTQNGVLDGRVQKYTLQVKDKTSKKTTEDIVFTNSIDSKKYAENPEYRKKVDYLLSRENIEGSRKLGGYLGEITTDNRVFDDENNFAAVMKYQREIEESKSIFEKIKRIRPSWKGPSDGR